MGLKINGIPVTNLKIRGNYSEEKPTNPTTININKGTLVGNCTVVYMSETGPATVPITGSRTITAHPGLLVFDCIGSGADTISGTSSNTALVRLTSGQTGETADGFAYSQLLGTVTDTGGTVTITLAPR